MGVKNNGKKIFISYRRNNGIDIAARVKDYFTSKGYNVFLDISSMKLGEFDKQLFNNIKNSDYFFLILSRNALDRCSDENDWVRKEIEYALNDERIMIIPLFLPGFEFPLNLPKSLEKLKYYQGVEYNAVLFDLVMDKLFQFINDKSTEQKNQNVQELIDILKNLYTITIDFREALRTGNQVNINTVTSNLITNIQKVYYYYEKYSHIDMKYSQIALSICNQFNAFVPFYNNFVNSSDRLSELAQEQAKLAEIEFNKLVSLILAVLNELEND